MFPRRTLNISIVPKRQVLPSVSSLRRSFAYLSIVAPEKWPLPCVCMTPAPSSAFLIPATAISSGQTTFKKPHQTLWPQKHLKKICWDHSPKSMNMENLHTHMVWHTSHSRSRYTSKSVVNWQINKVVANLISISTHCFSIRINSLGNRLSFLGTGP